MRHHALVLEHIFSFYHHLFSRLFLERHLVMALRSGSEIFHHLFSMISLGIIFILVLIPQLLHYFHLSFVFSLELCVEKLLGIVELLVYGDLQRDWQILYSRLVLDEEVFARLEAYWHLASFPFSSFPLLIFLDMDERSFLFLLVQFVLEHCAP